MGSSHRCFYSISLVLAVDAFGSRPVFLHAWGIRFQQNSCAASSVYPLPFRVYRSLQIEYGTTFHVFMEYFRALLCGRLEVKEEFPRSCWKDFLTTSQQNLRQLVVCHAHYCKCIVRWCYSTNWFTRLV